MGYLTNLIKNNFQFPNFSIKQIIKTSNMASAYLNNNYIKIEKLLKKGKKYYKSIKFNENNNYSLLHQSILDSNYEVIDLILNQTYSKDNDIIEDVDNTVGLAPIHLACLKDEVSIIKDLIVKGNSRTQFITKSNPKIELNLLHISAQVGSLRTLEYIHKEQKHSIDSVNDEGWTALHYACFMNKFDVCSYLIENNANLYLRNNQLLNPLESSIINDNLELFFSLLKFHYDIDKIYNSLSSAKFVHIAASCKKGTRILDFLLEDPNNIHEICNDDIKATPLHFAVMQDNLAAVKSLLRRSANPNCIDYLGNTPTNYACEKGNLEIIRQLYDNGADFTKKNFEGLNALQIAMYSENKEVKLYIRGLGRYKNMTVTDLM